MLYLRNFVTLFLCMFTTFMLCSQKLAPAQIKGHADFAVGEEVRLLLYDDLLTFTPRLAASAKIKADGSFDMSVQTAQILLAQLEIRTSRAEFFIEPSKNYNFAVNMDPDLFNLYSPQDYGGFLQVTNDVPDKNDLNAKINRFSHYFDAAFDHFSFKMVYDHDQISYDSMQTLLQNNFDIRYNPYDFYQSYLFYQVSNLDRLYWQKDADSLFNKYLNNDHVLYNHPGYMDFFNSFYDDYVFMSAKIDMKTVLDCINTEPDYRKLFNALGSDEFLVNERIRELVIIKNLGQLYLNHPEFDKKNVVLLLEEIKEHTHFAEHRPLAENMLKFVAKFSDDQLLKDVKLKEANGRDFSLKKMKGKWVYLHFFRTDCLECVREMLLIKEIGEMFKDSLAMVGVCVDFDKYGLQNFLNRYPQLDWDFVHFNQQYQWLGDLEMNALPDYVLIAPNGSIYERYLPAPASGLVDHLSHLFKKGEANDNNPMFQQRNVKTGE